MFFKEVFNMVEHRALAAIPLFVFVFVVFISFCLRSYVLLSLVRGETSLNPQNNTPFHGLANGPSLGTLFVSRFASKFVLDEKELLMVRC
jgi:hypothetical protein